MKSKAAVRRRGAGLPGPAGPGHRSHFRPGNAGVPELDRKFDRLPFKTGKPDGSVGGVPAGDFRGVRRNRDRQEFFPGVFRDPAELRLPPLPLRLGGRESGEKYPYSLGTDADAGILGLV